jgi:hypothetical protein
MKDTLTLEPNVAPNTISFTNEKYNVEPFIKLCENGDIFVKGKLIENDIEVVDAMREFLTQQNFIKK